nr:Protein kinase [uncultured bacterium]
MSAAINSVLLRRGSSPPAEPDPEPVVSETVPVALLPTPEEPAPAPLAARAPAHARRTWPFLAGAAGALVAALAAVLLGLGRAEGEAPVAGPGHDPRRIAVLYFDDYSRGGELGYLANGLTEMLIHELSQVEALDVISRNGVKPYREGRVPLDSVAARLRVGSLVEGSVQRSGDSVRVVVQLIDANTQSHLESRAVVRPMGDVLALESALAEEVGGFLRRRLGREVRLRQAGAGTRSPEARALVLQAERAMDDAGRVAESADPADAAAARRLLATADSLLARAEAADPAWTRPPVLRGRAAITAANALAAPDRPALLAAAERHAGRVLAREPRHAEALQVRGAARWWTGVALGQAPGAAAWLERAERDLRAAVAADPSFALGWGSLARLLLVRGSLAEAGVAARRALAADAYLEDADALLLRLFFTALGQADYGAARDACGRGARMFPGSWRFVECRLTLLREDSSRPPDPALAWRLVAELERMDPGPRARAAGRGYAPLYRRLAAAAVSARAGDADSARAVLARARRDAAADSASRVSLAYDEAYVLLVLGERDAARHRLKEYAAARPELRAYLPRDPLFRDLYAPRAAR